jgi:hypothetical protein
MSLEAATEGPQRKYTFPKVPVSILSVTAGNKLISKDVNICYGGHISQQAGYQESPILVAV